MSIDNRKRGQPRFFYAKAIENMDAGIILGWGIAIFFIGGIAYLTLRGIRQLNIRLAMRAAINTQKNNDPDLLLFDHLENRFLLTTINGKISKRQNGMFTLSP